jgi:hypothetical protein
MLAAAHLTRAMSAQIPGGNRAQAHHGASHAEPPTADGLKAILEPVAEAAT